MTSSTPELAKRYTHAQSLKRWDGIKGCSLARITLGIFGDDQETLRLTVGFLTGHCQLRKHLHTMGLVDTPLGRMWEQEDDTVVNNRVCVWWVLVYTCRHKRDVP